MSYRKEWQRIFFVSSEENVDLFRRFKNWMEEKHILKIQSSGCFLVEYKKALDPYSESANHFQIVSYTLYPKDEESWQVFNEEFRAGFEREFSEEWFPLQRTNRVISGEIVSVPTEENTVMTMTPKAEVPAHQR